MKTILSLIFCFTTVYTNFAQDKLYYFIDPSTSLMGVKNSSGQVIIPAKYNYLYQNAEELNARLTGPTIYMFDWESHDSTKKKRYLLSVPVMCTTVKETCSTTRFNMIMVPIFLSKSLPGVWIIITKRALQTERVKL